MHVHWKEKEPGRLTAYLVQSVREGRKVRHRTISYLGGVDARVLREFESKNELRQLAARLRLNEFWDRVGDKLREIQAETRHIWDRLETRIPPVRYNEANEAERQLETVRRELDWAVYRELLKQPSVQIKDILENEALKKLRHNEPDLAQKVAAAIQTPR